MISAQGLRIIKAQDVQDSDAHGQQKQAIRASTRRAVSANSALDDGESRILRAQVKQLRADVRMASVKSKMGYRRCIRYHWSLAAFSAGGIGYGQ